MSDEEKMTEPVVESEELTDLAVVTEALLGGHVELETDPDVIMQEIVRRILATPEAERVFDPQHVYHARDVQGQCLQVRAVRWFPSAFENGPKVYAVLDAVIHDTGEHAPVTIGAAGAMAQLVVALRNDLLPVDLVIRQADRPTAAGFWPLRLERCRPPEEAG